MNMTTKADVIDFLAAQPELNLNKEQAKAVLNTLSDFYASSLAANSEVSIPGIGKLRLGVRPSRTGRNPKTGEALEIPEKVTARFSASKTLKDRIAQ